MSIKKMLFYDRTKDKNVWLNCDYVLQEDLNVVKLFEIGNPKNVYWVSRNLFEVAIS